VWGGDTSDPVHGSGVPLLLDVPDWGMHAKYQSMYQKWIANVWLLCFIPTPFEDCTPNSSVGIKAIDIKHLRTIWSMQDESVYANGEGLGCGPWPQSFAVGVLVVDIMQHACKMLAYSMCTF
jgi:hypothetical protein